MANNKSAKKRILQTAVRTERNRYYRTRIKNIIKAVHEAVASENKENATSAFKIANQQIHSLVSKGFIKKTTAARKVSRLHKMVNAIEAA
ncbi:MAG: 30S ribosomal protein S20 [Sulfurovum sp.]